MFLKKLFGTSSTRYIKKIYPEIQKINDFYDGLSSKSDQGLVDRTNELKKIISNSRDVIKSQFQNEINSKDFSDIFRRACLNSGLMVGFLGY